MNETSTGGAGVAPLTLVAEDGFPLAATRFRAQGARRGIVLCAPATGVRQRYYQPFAEWLAAQGFDTLTWDWRGVADSRHGVNWRDRRLTMRSWGTLDLQAAIEWADRRDGSARLAVVGHSFGGQALGLAPNAHRVNALALIAAQDPWMGNWPLRLRLPLALLWCIAMPVCARVLGRFPSSKVGLGEDLPEGVARDWASWGRSRSGMDWSGHSGVSPRLKAWTFTDDWIAPPSAAEALVSRYSGALISGHRLIRPEDRGHTRLGHFGFFRPGLMPDLWTEVADFLGAPDDA